MKIRVLVAVAFAASIAPPAWSATDTEIPGGPPTVRRLTEAQYRATVADIFAPDIAIVGRFERELREDGLIAVGTSQAGMSAFSVEQYDASARGVAKEVVSKERRAKLVPCQVKAETSFDKDCATHFVQIGRASCRERECDAEEAARSHEIARGAR